MRAREPDVTGTAIADDGVRIAYESFGSGDPTLVLLPSAPIVIRASGRARSPTSADTTA